MGQHAKYPPVGKHRQLHADERRAVYRYAACTTRQSSPYNLLPLRIRAEAAHLAPKEILGAVLATIHNIRFFTRFMAAIRESIEEDRFEAFYERNRALLEGNRDAEGEESSDA